MSQLFVPFFVVVDFFVWLVAGLFREKSTAGW
jgi:hypothetical protein